MSDNKSTILCIDDNKDTRKIVEHWLVSAGFNVIAAENYNEAVNRARQPDLILQDVLMPDMDGYECCRKLQQNKDFTQVPVVFLTALQGEADKTQALAAGGVDFLVKPAGRDKLLETVRRHIATRKRWARLANGKAPMADSRGFVTFLMNALNIPESTRTQFQGLSAARLYEVAPKLGLSEEQLAKYMAEFAKVPFISEICAANVELGTLPGAFCRAHQVVPLYEPELGKRFALSNPLDFQLIDSLKSLFDERPKIVAATPTQIRAILEPNAVSTTKESPADGQPASPKSMKQIENELVRLYHVEPAMESVLPEDVSEESAPIIKMVNSLINGAIEAGASDIHIEPCEHDVIVRYRVDGELRIVNRLRPQKLCLPLTARIKIMSNLDITEKRLPQDGRIAFNDNVDLRVASSPMNHGEKLVLRLLDKKKAALSLDALGFSKRNLEIYRGKIKSPYGMVLHVGPTGSGKSMSLFSALREIQRPELNIQTIEDPIEYTLPGINQMQTHSEIGLTFQRALRSYLRQDPDVILVGEIRDRETAHAAVEAAMTGHMLFSTLHTNDAASTVVRLIEMGVEPYLVSSSLVMVCAQRLLRRLCEHCKEVCEATQGEKVLLGAQPDDSVTVYKAKGCPECSGTGYRGRIGVHELLVLNDETRELLSKKGLSADTLKQHAVKSCGMTTLYWDSIEKVRDGITSLEEVLANVRRDEFDPLTVDGHMSRATRTMDVTISARPVSSLVGT